MTPVVMREVVQEALLELGGDWAEYDPGYIVETTAVQTLIKYIDNLEAELVVRRAADTKYATPVILRFNKDEKQLDSTPA